MTLLGTMAGEAKLAEFLVSLATRFAARGYSSTEFNLRMSRSEIGSYLGLTLETVCRIFSRLQRLGLIRTKDREVRIVDLPGATPGWQRCFVAVAGLTLDARRRATPAASAPASCAKSGATKRRGSKGA